MEQSSSKGCRHSSTKGDATCGFFPLWNPPSSLGRSELTSRMHKVTFRPRADKPNRNEQKMFTQKTWHYPQKAAWRLRENHLAIE